MGWIQANIYPILPVFAQNLAISVYGYQWKQRRFGGNYQVELKGFRDREGYSSQQWREYQTVQLRKLLTHAFETVPLYRERYARAGFTKSQLGKFELEALPTLPYLTKEDLRTHGTGRLLSSKRENGGAFFSSSGSTGTPTKILYSHAFHQRMNAAMEARVRNWAGVSAQDPRGMIGGRRILPTSENKPPYYRFNIFEKQTYFSAYHISKQNTGDYVQGMEKHKVRFMTGYAMSNYFLAAYLDELGVEAPAMKAVITSSEKLTARMRETFRRVYDCRVFDSYSGVENCGLISECPEGTLLISPDVGIMEVVDETGNPVGPGETGEVISTGFLNFDQPLIRYKIGDRVTTGTLSNNSGGRNMPVIQEITGRMEDTVITPDGRKMVRFHGIFVDLPNVLEGQVIQHTLTRLTVKIVAASRITEQEKVIIAMRMKSQIGEEADIEVVVVDEIPRTANGKFKAVISKLNQKNQI